jgi:hypothetical protein
VKYCPAPLFTSAALRSRSALVGVALHVGVYLEPRLAVHQRDQALELGGVLDLVPRLADYQITVFLGLCYILVQGLGNFRMLPDLYLQSPFSGAPEQQEIVQLGYCARHYYLFIYCCQATTQVVGSLQREAQRLRDAYLTYLPKQLVSSKRL